jgi:hypothetical protein
MTGRDKGAICFGASALFPRELFLDQVSATDDATMVAANETANKIDSFNPNVPLPAGMSFDGRKLHVAPVVDPSRLTRL